MAVRQEGRGAQDRGIRDAYDTPRRPTMYHRARGTSATLMIDMPEEKVARDESDSSSSSSLPSPSSEDGLELEDRFMPAMPRRKGERHRAPNTEWTKMDRVVRKADKGKMKNCKEDIDTLLVFAGLFSAVLTAFVIASYALLQPDTGAEAVTILRQISLQLASYTINPGFANSTQQVVSEFISPGPSGTQVLVNALWFASLILSLTTASLAMLVKQWLHEYLSGDYYSPQARLRIRQFRHEGVERWYVIEIAAFLPLLLQISLGLFFLGLCNFTFSANLKVGWTTIPLVIAWLVVFVLMIIAPIFSPRCPYKVTFLVGAFKVLRSWIRRAICFMHQRSDPLLPSSDSNSELPGSVECTELHWLEEEEDTVTSPTSDLRIFLAADAMLSDDSLIGGFYRDHILQLRSSGPEVVDFVLAVMDRRMRRREQVSRAKLPLRDLKPMSKLAWVGLTTILADKMEDAVVQDMLSPAREGRNAYELVDWMKDILKIVMSDSGGPFQQSEANIVVHALLYDSYGTAGLLRQAKRHISPSDFSHIVDLSRETLKPFDPDRVINCILTLGRWAVSRYSDSIFDVIKSHRLEMKGVMAVAGVLVDKLSQELDWRHEFGGSIGGWDDWLDDALHCVVRAFARFGVQPESRDRRGVDVPGVIWRLCVEGEVEMAAVLHRLPEHDSISDESDCPCLFACAMGHSNIGRDDRLRMLDNFEKLVEDAIGPEPRMALSRDKLYDIARCMSSHQTLDSSESHRWHAFCSLLRPGDHALDATENTAVEPAGSSDELTPERLLDSGYMEDPRGSSDPFLERTDSTRPLCASPGPITPELSLSSSTTGIRVASAESGFVMVNRPHANTTSNGAGWSAGYAPVFEEDGETSPTERGFGEIVKPVAMQLTPAKRPPRRGRTRFLSPLRRPRIRKERARSLDSACPDMAL